MKRQSRAASGDCTGVKSCQSIADGATCESKWPEAAGSLADAVAGEVSISAPASALGLLHDLAWAPKYQHHANVESWICASAALTLLTLYTLLSFCGYFVPPNGVCTPVTHSLRNASSSPSAPLTGASIRRRELARPSVDFTQVMPFQQCLGPILVCWWSWLSKSVLLLKVAREMSPPLDDLDQETVS